MFSITGFEMKFAEVVENIARSNDLKRIAKARLYDTSRLSQEDVRAGLIEKYRQYSDESEILAALQAVILHDDRDVRTVSPILLGQVLLQEHECSFTQKETEDAVIDWEQSVVADSKEKGLAQRQIHNFEFFRFVLEAAWENNNSISRDEKNLIEKIRQKLRINEREYRIVEAQLSQFPKEGNEVHQREDINRVRNYLQESGLLLTYRNSDGEDCDVIPDEMIPGLRKAFDIEIKKYGYCELIKHKAVRKVSYLVEVLEKCDISLVGNLKLPDLQTLCVEHVSPKVLLGGLTPKDGLEKQTLEKWCRELALQVTGTKVDLIDRVVAHYDELIERPVDLDDEREPWFAYFEEFASRNYGFLRAQGLIDRDLDVESRFEKATDYLFEKLMGHKPLPLPGSEQPDGALAVGNEVLFWDNKSKESKCELSAHVAQFDRYFAKADEKVLSLVVIAPDFTDSSHDTALQHEVRTGNRLSLITARELKEIAVRWSASAKKDDPFPLRYLSATGRFNPNILGGII